MSALTSVLEKIRSFEPPDVLSGSEPLIVYGAGGFGRELARVLQARGKTILGFLDRGACRDAGGLPCRHPESNLQDWLAQDTTVLIGLHNHLANPWAVRDEMLSKGFKRVYLPVEFHHLLEPELGERYWLGGLNLYRRHLEELESVFHLLADKKSRELLLSTLEYRALNFPEAHPLAEPGEAYFPTDLPRWADDISWIDGGACDGDSLRTFPLDRYRCRNVYAFEPDLKNFSKLQIAARQFREKSPDTHVAAWPCGLGAENILLKFKTGLGLASAASAEGETQCPIVRLDSVLHGYPVNLIKLDVEGAEPEALRGAGETIAQQKPGLAVCIYHKPGHLWEIPLEIARSHSHYRFYLRCHGQSSFDLVLYALPV